MGKQVRKISRVLVGAVMLKSKVLGAKIAEF